MSNSTWIIVRRVLSIPFLGCGTLFLVMLAVTWLAAFEDIGTGLVVTTVFGLIAAALVGAGLGLWGKWHIKIVFGTVLAAGGAQALLMAVVVGSMAAGWFGELSSGDYDNPFTKRMALGSAISAIVLLASSALILVPEIRPLLKRRPPGARPILTWVVLGWQIYSAFGVLISLLLAVSGYTLLTPEQLEYIAERSPFGVVMSIMLAAMQLVAAVYLVRLRRFAAWLFLAALIVSVLWSAIVGFEPPPGMSAAFLLLAAIFGYSVTIAICAYSWWLLKRGVLK